MVYTETPSYLFYFKVTNNRAIRLEISCFQPAPLYPSAPRCPGPLIRNYINKINISIGCPGGQKWGQSILNFELLTLSRNPM